MYAIISKFDTARPEIPFFSKVALDAVCSQLAAMDIDVALARIKEIQVNYGWFNAAQASGGDLFDLAFHDTRNSYGT